MKYKHLFEAVGDLDWHHKVLNAAQNKGIDFTHEVRSGNNNQTTIHVNAADPKHEAAMHDHLKSWILHKGAGQYQNNEQVKIFLNRSEEGKAIEKSNAAAAEHQKWKDDHKADRESGMFRKRY